MVVTSGAHRVDCRLRPPRRQAQLVFASRRRRDTTGEPARNPCHADKERVMRSTWMPLLAACVLLAATPFARAEDLPYAGNWKISVLDPRFEATFWLVEIDKPAKEVKLLWGLGG